MDCGTVIDETARCRSTTRKFTQRCQLLGFVAFALFLLTGCGQLAFSGGPLLHDVTMEPQLISPNADGDTDVTDVFYSLRRPAGVSIYFEKSDGERFYFRRERRRSAGDYNVQWGGVVDQPEVIETAGGRLELLSRVLEDGEYRWVIEAVEENGNVETATGRIVLEGADTEMPELHNFAVVPDIFRPNQDGLRDDWVSISYYLTKDVDEVLVYLIDPDDPDVRFFLPEAPGLVDPVERGYHEYRYEGGVDLNAEPPPDGLYAIIGEARDAAGNAVRVTQELTIEEGGKPRCRCRGGRDRLDGRNEPRRQRAARRQALFSRGGDQRGDSAHPHHRSMAGSGV